MQKDWEGIHTDVRFQPGRALAEEKGHLEKVCLTTDLFPVQLVALSPRQVTEDPGELLKCLSHPVFSGGRSEEGRQGD